MFTKQNLTVGMLIQNRQGGRYVVMPDPCEGLILARTTSWDPLDHFTPNMKHDTDPSLDIMKVYEYEGGKLGHLFQTSTKRLLWECKPEFMVIHQVSLQDSAGEFSHTFKQGEIVNLVAPCDEERDYYAKLDCWTKYAIPKNLVVEKED